MADLDGTKTESKEKEYFTNTPQEAPGFFLKGSHQYDWIEESPVAGIQSKDWSDDHAGV